MSVRHKILAMLNERAMTAVEMNEECDGALTARQVIDNTVQAVKDGLVSRSRDDVTGMPLYAITEAGKGRLKSGPLSSGGQAKAANKKKVAFTISGKGATENATDWLRKENLRLIDANRELVEELDAAHARIRQLEDGSMVSPGSDLLGKANAMLVERLAGVAHALRGSGLDGLKNVEAGEDLQPHVAALTGAYQMAVSQRDAWRELAGNVGVETPDELRQYINDLLMERRVSPGVTEQPAVSIFGQNHGYAVMLMDDAVGVYDTLAEASDTALLSLKNDPGVGYRVAVVQIVAMAENAVMQRWLEAA